MFRRQFRTRTRLFWRSTRRFILHNVLHADDPPDRLAMGAAIGVFIAFTPAIGLQMLLVVFLAWLLRANKVIGVPLVWISNPATIIPIFYGCYSVGRFVLQRKAIGGHWWNELYRPPDSWWDAVLFYWHHFMDIAGPLWLGSFIVGFLLAYPTYYVLAHLIYRYRMRRWGQPVPPLATALPPRSATPRHANEDAHDA
jgi:uncharacterized protein (TIGR03546 family)